MYIYIYRERARERKGAVIAQTLESNQGKPNSYKKKEEEIKFSQISKERHALHSLQGS